MSCNSALFEIRCRRFSKAGKYVRESKEWELTAIFESDAYYW